MSTATGIGDSIHALSQTDHGVTVTIAGTDYTALNSLQESMRGNNSSLKYTEGINFILRWSLATDLPSPKAQVFSGGKQYVISNIVDSRQHGGFIRIVCHYAPRW